MRLSKWLLITFLLWATKISASDHIERLSELLQDVYSSEYVKARQVRDADLNGIKHQIVMYTIEGLNGGNSHNLVLAAFRDTQWMIEPGKHKGPIVHRLIDFEVVSSSGYEGIENLMIEGNTIVVRLHSRVPSIKPSEKVYQLGPHNLTLINVQTID